MDVTRLLILNDCDDIISIKLDLKTFLVNTLKLFKLTILSKF